MNQENPLVQDSMLRKIVAARDSRLHAVGLGEPDATIMAQLLAALPGVTVESDIRYLAPGRSGAKVVVLINPQDLPVVVKFGLKADIQREQRNYTDSRVEERIPQEIRPALRQSFQIGEHAALVYSWAGASEQVKSFRDFFRAARSEELDQLVTALMKGLFPWHSPRKSAELPFNQWQWDDVILGRVLESIQQWHASAESKQKLIAALQGQDRWRDTLLTKRGSVGTCHGDLNCHNILVANENSLPKLIDFASVSQASSPARDYAKLEREIKLRCLRDLISDSEKFVGALEQVDRCSAVGHSFTSTDEHVTKTVRLVTTLRDQFCLRSANLSDIPFIEYLYFLFCWTLAYLTNHEGASESVEVRDAIIDSAERILDLLESEISNINKSSALRAQSEYMPIPSAQQDPNEALSRGGQNLERDRHREMFETMYLLLLLDQFQNGIWGASLEAAADYYGHSNDPGSISVSTFSCFAITRFSGSRTAIPIQDFRDYLQRRQSPRGAFGMKRESGTKKYPKSEILEHARHTATALSFFVFYDGYGHTAVTRALDYLFNERTPEGLWVDYGPLSDDNVDPITAAFVIDSFEQLRRSIIDEQSGAEENSQIIVQIDSCIAKGLNYLFTSPLRSKEGFWHYKYSSDEERNRVLRNLYQYTTDVLSAITFSCKRLESYLSEIDMILDRLLSITSKHGGGLPRSPETHVPDLDATGRLISTAINFPKWVGSAHRLWESLPALCSDSQVLMSGGANGWSSILLLYGAPGSPSHNESDERINHINSLAQKIKVGDPDTIELPPEVVKYQNAIRDLLRRRRGVQPL